MCHLKRGFCYYGSVFFSIASSWGLTVSLAKTKRMKIGNEPSFEGGVPVCDESVEMVKEFSYLGIFSTVSNDGECDDDVKVRFVKAANTFGCLKKSIFTSSCLSIAVKPALYKAVVLTTLLYGSES